MVVLCNMCAEIRKYVPNVLLIFWRNGWPKLFYNILLKNDWGKKRQGKIICGKNCSHRKYVPNNHVIDCRCRNVLYMIKRKILTSHKLTYLWNIHNWGEEERAIFVGIKRNLFAKDMCRHALLTTLNLSGNKPSMK